MTRPAENPTRPSPSRDPGLTDASDAAMGPEGLTPEELLTTTRSVRRRLDLTRPVDLEVVFDCLRVALQAPNGADEQAWRFVVVVDPDQRARIGELYRQANEGFAAAVRARAEAGDAQAARKLASSGVFWDHLADVPVLVVAGFEPQAWYDPASTYARASAYGSVFPAVWNFQLAARLRGLGTCLVTSHLHYAAEISALLELPKTFEQAGMVAVGHLGDDAGFKPARRVPLDQVVHLDRW
jgi:nitroreductase